MVHGIADAFENEKAARSLNFGQPLQIKKIQILE